MRRTIGPIALATLVLGLAVVAPAAANPRVVGETITVECTAAVDLSGVRMWTSGGVTHTRGLVLTTLPFDLIDGAWVPGGTNTVVVNTNEVDGGPATSWGTFHLATGELEATGHFAIGPSGTGRFAGSGTAYGEDVIVRGTLGVPPEGVALPPLPCPDPGFVLAEYLRTGA